MGGEDGLNGGIIQLFGKDVANYKGGAEFVFSSFDLTAPQRGFALYSYDGDWTRRFWVTESFVSVENLPLKNIKRYNQSAEPSLNDKEMCIWRDPDDGKVYLIYKDETSGQKKVELT